MDELTAGDLAVRACFQVSFDALPRPGRPGGADPARVFRLLGVWQGPSIGLSAAAALAAQPEEKVADALEVLVDTNLLESPAPDRYRLHDLLRAYAAERAQADEPAEDVESAIHRVLTWYLRAADAARGAVSPHRNPVPLEPPEPDSEPLAVAREIGAVRLEGYAQYNLGRAHLELGSTAAAVGLLEQALGIHRGAGDKYGEAQDLQQIGIAHTRAGKPEDALMAWRRAREIFESLGDQKQVQELRSRLAELGVEPAQA